MDEYHFAWSLAVVYELNNFLFLSRVIFFIAISLFIADVRSGISSIYTNFTGRRIFVYFAPRPLLCTATRRSGSTAQPV